MAKKDRKWLYYIDNVLPNKRVHLLSGPTGAGKTSWLFQAMSQWTKGQDVLGFATHGQELGKFFFVAADRSEDETAETLWRMGIDEDAFGWKAMPEQGLVKEDFYKVPEDTRILAIDGVERMVEQGRVNDFRGVQDLMLGALSIACSRNMAIVFLNGAPKMKRGEEYKYGRERVIGSTAWGRFASTVFNINMTGEPDQVGGDNKRRLLIFPKNYQASEHSLKFDDTGKLLEIANEETTKMEAIVMNATSLTDWTTRAQLVELAQIQGVSESTVDRALRMLVQRGILQREAGKGYIQVPSRFLLGMGNVEKVEGN